MIKSIEELGLNEELTRHVKEVESFYNKMAIEEQGEHNMLQWINNNLEEAGNDSFLAGLSDREKFLYAFGVLSASLI